MSSVFPVMRSGSAGGHRAVLDGQSVAQNTGSHREPQAPVLFSAHRSGLLRRRVQFGASVASIPLQSSQLPLLQRSHRALERH